jgi:enoyl-CoA hydratase
VELATLSVDMEGPVATIKLNRPRVLNCIDDRMVGDLHAAIDAVTRDAGLRVVVMRGSGRAFCSGIDLTALAHGAIGSSFYRQWELALRGLETIDPIVIAAVHSHCIGGGLQLALACDLRIARRDARFGVTAVKEGIVPGLGIWRIARYAGLGRAKQLALAADVVSAETAQQWGLVDYIVEAEAFEAQISALTTRVLAMAATSTRLTKRLLDLAFDAPFPEAVDALCDYQQQALASPEHQRAMAEHRAARRRASVGEALA